MAIEFLAGGIITGLSTDAKPDRDTSDTTNPALTVQPGSVFYETDTGSKFVHNGTAWVQQTFDSINEALGNGGGVSQRQHMVEWFTGHSLNTKRWTVTNQSGASTADMNDEVDGGVKLLTGASTNDYKQLDFDDVYQFDYFGSVCIFVAKRLASTGSRYDIGFQNGTDLAYIRNNANDTYYSLKSSDGSSNGSADFSVAVDNNFHVGKIELQPELINGYLDGVLEGTITGSGLPNLKLEPWLKCTHNASAVAETNVTYYEAYNY